MYYARDTSDGVIINGKNIISIPGQYVGRVDYINENGEFIVGRYFYKEDVLGAQKSKANMERISCENFRAYVYSR